MILHNFSWLLDCIALLPFASPSSFLTTTHISYLTIVTIATPLPFTSFSFVSCSSLSLSFFMISFSSPSSSPSSSPFPLPFRRLRKCYRRVSSKAGTNSPLIMMKWIPSGNYSLHLLYCFLSYSSFTSPLCSLAPSTASHHLLYSINHCGFGYTPIILYTSNFHTHPLTKLKSKYTHTRTHAHHHSYSNSHCPHFNSLTHVVL